MTWENSSSLVGLGVIKVTEIFQGTITYTPTAGARSLFVECVGGGGGGGGVATAVTNDGAAGGGGGGAYSCIFLTSIAAPYTVQVGAGGAGGVVGANPGSDGTDSTFGTVCTAEGGHGGAADTVGVATARVGGLGGLGGENTQGLGDLMLDGCSGGTGICLVAAQAISGQGGTGPWGGAPLPKIAQGTGNAGGQYGAGGSGGCILSGGASVAGGAGANGVIRVWELG